MIFNINPIIDNFNDNNNDNNNDNGYNTRIVRYAFGFNNNNKEENE